MLPFCGDNMGDYFAHWLKIGASAADPGKLPRIFFVNWFRKDQEGKFVWPGFGENARVLKWIAERLKGAAEAEDTAIGRVPTRTALDLGGLGLTASQLDTLLLVDHDVWREEAALIPEFFSKFAGRLPEELWRQHRALEARLSSQPMRTETAQGATPPR